MKRLLMLVWAGICLTHILPGQINQKERAPIERCGTEVWENERQTLNPLLETREEFEQWLMVKKKEQQEANRATSSIYTIPVIIHVVHDGEPIGTGFNISYEQIQSQIDVLNEDFRRKAGTPGSNTNPAGADIEIEFCMVTTDPDGGTLAEPGVDRINRNDAGFTAPPYLTGYASSTIQTATFWNPEEYMNIWVLPLANDFLGYAQLPNSSTLTGLPSNNGGAATDGVVINTQSFGRQGNVSPPYDQGRTTTHEVGHWMGLVHIWGDDSCGNDFCGDTPAASGPHYGCPSNDFSCGSTDMIENYMDYTDDVCMNIFTQNQKDRMRIVMENAARRVNLLNSSRCSQSGLAPVADFSVSHEQVCVGSAIQFTDLSAFNPTSRSWTFEGGSPGTSTAVNPSVEYNQPGIYKVTLTVANGAGSNTLERINYIEVIEPVATTFYIEDFENGFGDWTIDNPELDRTWTLVEVGGNTPGNRAMYVNHYLYTNIGRRDGLISRKFDLSAYDGATLSFEHAHRRFSNNEQDSLIVYLSTDDGQTFPHRLFAGAEDGSQDFATGPLSNTNFVPATASDWCFSGSGWADCIEIDLNNFQNEQNVRIKFETVNDYGNNIFIDNIQLFGTCRPVRVGIDSEASSEYVTLYPNPTQGQLEIQLADLQGSVEVSLWNGLGQQLRAESWDMKGSSFLQTWNLETLNPGIYIFRVESQQGTFTEKIMVQR
ncbi:MAG: M43 family zinc metalloprotease [Bacteroidota bacterium]